MEVWTIQKEEVLEKVKGGAVWAPDLKKGACPPLRLCYELALEIYNAHNRHMARGLVFTMARTDFHPFGSADETGRLLSDNTNLRNFLRTGEGSLLSEGNVLARLSYPDTLNPVPVDVCAFTAFRPFLTRVDEDGEPCIAFDMNAAPDPDVPVAVANHMLKTGLALLHHNDLYCTAKEDNFEKLKQKLAGYKLSALSSYLPQ